MFIGKKVIISHPDSSKSKGVVINELPDRRFAVVADTGITHIVTHFEIIIEIPEEGWDVNLTYFKQSGKVYSDGNYKSFKVNMFEIFEEVQQFVEQGRLPGLAAKCSEFVVLIDVPEHPHSHPALCNVRGQS